jgi:hypothetical protein
VKINLDKDNFSYISFQNHKSNADYIENLFLDLFLIDFAFCVVNVGSIRNSNKANPFVLDIADCYEHIRKCQQKAIHSDKIFIVVLESIQEIPTYNNFKDIIDNLIKEFDLSYKQILIFSLAFECPGSPVQHLPTYVMPFNGKLRMYSYQSEPTHHFISLSRSPRASRVFSTIMLLDRGLDKYGYISLGAMTNHPYIYHTAKERLPDRYKDRYPFLIDGLIEDYDDQFNQDSKITDAFFNFITETATDVNSGDNFWTAPSITEKTTRAFALGQVPIIIAPFKTLQHIRSMGFDLFDDIIDNNYDNEPVQYFRIIKAVEQLEKVCNMPMEYWREWKKQNIHRFEKNHALLQNLIITHIDITRGNLDTHLSNLKSEDIINRKQIAKQTLVEVEVETIVIEELVQDISPEPIIESIHEIVLETILEPEPSVDIPSVIEKKSKPYIIFPTNAEDRKNMFKEWKKIR